MLEFVPKVGDTVLVCHDGIKDRGVKGRVLKCMGKTILVSFAVWKNPRKRVEQWFPAKTENSYGAYLISDEGTTVEKQGPPGDWYTVISNNS